MWKKKISGKHLKQEGTVCKCGYFSFKKKSRQGLLNQSIFCIFINTIQYHVLRDKKAIIDILFSKLI